MCADVVVQPLPPDRHPEFTATISAAFGNHPDPRKGELMESIQPDDRRLGALDGDRVVGTAASFAFDMTVPGGATVPVAGVTAVGVLATHRRRGVLRQLMAAQLDDVVRRGEAIAILTASESGIYRRFGYGIGSFIRSTELDSDRIGFADRRGDELELVLLRGDEARPLIAPIYDRWRRARPGAVAFTPAWWDVTLGPIPNYIGGGDQFVVVCEPQHGRGGGFARYTAGPPGGSMTLDVASVIAEDPVVESRLWRYLTEVDLSNRVRVEQVPVDCPLRWQVTDPRQVRTTLDRDWLHVRILDVPAALSARRYAADGELTMAVTDAFRPGPATGGRFRLTVRDGEGRCEPAAGEPELTLDVAALGSAYLGGVRLTDLAAAGIVASTSPARWPGPTRWWCGRWRRSARPTSDPPPRVLGRRRARTVHADGPERVRSCETDRMGCLLVLLAWLSPRFVLALLWIFTNRLSIAFDSGLVGVAGFLFLPYTSVMWALAYHPDQGVTGIGWVLVGLAVLSDLSSWGGGERHRRSR